MTRLLCACWLTSQDKEFIGESVTVMQWRQQMTAVLRALRQSLPKHHNALAQLRERLASAELEAERIELALAWQAISAEQATENKSGQSTALARQNLYAAAPNAYINPEVRELIDQLVAFLLPDSPIQTDR